jgi:hypothetical protein
VRAPSCKPELGARLLGLADSRTADAINWIFCRSSAALRVGFETHAALAIRRESSMMDEIFCIWQRALPVMSQIATAQTYIRIV